MPQLNADVYTLIFLHIHDFDCIRRSAEAVSLSKKHPLRDVLLRKLLKTNIILSSHRDYIQPSESLISFLIENPHLAERVQSVFLTLDASSDGHPGSASEIDAINLRLAKMTQKLLKETRGLKYIQWTGAPGVPGPDEECLRVLAGLERLEKFVVDCVDDTDDGYEYLEIGQLLRILGPNLKSLYLSCLYHELFRIICENSEPLTNLGEIYFNFTGERWDADREERPSDGPPVFPEVQIPVRKASFFINDIDVAANEVGVVGLVETSRLAELSLEVIHCHVWTLFYDIKLFSSLSGQNFPSLVRLVIKDEVWNTDRWNWEEGEDFNRYSELGRAYFGIHEFVSELPALKELWMDERSLLIPLELSEVDEDEEFDNEDEDRYSTSMDENMMRTFASPQWPMIVRTFERLESLRIGFGPLSANWVKLVLSVCDRRKLKQFGFDFAWKPLHTDDVLLDPELLNVLASHTELTDIHILYPRPGVGKHRYNDVTIADVRKIIKACPNVYRVGIGSENVWERRTPCNMGEDDGEGPQVQLLGKDDVPDFYSAGSGYYPGDGRGYYGKDICAERELEGNWHFYDLLKSLSS